MQLPMLWTYHRPHFLPMKLRCLTPAMATLRRNSWETLCPIRRCAIGLLYAKILGARILKNSPLSLRSAKSETYDLSRNSKTHYTLDAQTKKRQQVLSKLRQEAKS